MEIELFDKQAEVLESKSRIKFVFAGKRGAKTWLGALQTILYLENKPDYTSGNDPYKAAIAAPTFDMLRRLSMGQFHSFGKGYIREFNKSRQEAMWHDGSIIYGLSADRPQRAEGLKLNLVWIDECLQVSEQFFLEMLARTADSKGHILCTSSLGVQYTNPKQTWCYRFAHQEPLDNSETFEWPSTANPHLPEEALLSLKDSLDPRTYRQMFEIDWNIPGTNLVFDDFSESNLQKSIQLNPNWEISCSVDWGWAHEMAAIFTAYDQKTDTVYVFDEIVKSRLKREDLYDQIKSKRYPIRNHYCDISGKKDTEAQNLSNVQWFKAPPRNITFKFRTARILPSLSLVRSYILDGAGRRRLIVDSVRCPKLVDQLMNYRYPVDKAGQVMNENPVKENDDAIDALRYYFINRLDKKAQNTFSTMDRWNLWQSHSHPMSSNRSLQK